MCGLGHFTLGDHKKRRYASDKKRLKKRTYKQPEFYGITLTLSYQRKYVK
jgi:hypothetical protein